MSLADRINKFQKDVVAKKLLHSKVDSFNRDYFRLILARRTAEFLLCTCIIYGGQQLVILNTFFSPIWPASGVALSAIFLRGRTMLFSIFVGTFASYFSNNYASLLSLQQALLFTLIIWLTRESALKWIGAVAPIPTLRIFLKFVLLLGIFCALHAFVIAFFIQTFHSDFSWYRWILAVLGEYNGILCLTPLCLVSDPFVVKNYFNKKACKWWICALLLIIAHGLFFIMPVQSLILVAFFLFISVCVYALNFGQIPTCITLFGISIIYLAGVLPKEKLFQNTIAQSETLFLCLFFTLTILVSLGLGTFKQQQRYYSIPPVS
ncbi:MAG: MASE1 domain-containing protein [Proteobacteria bacterium]|nr:MASE1 domain-containing protein [Pseudomonadota bacterium]